jgi:DNA primase small subunit
MLENDFGFAENEIHTFFSGHRGYHIHVENEAARSLDAMARKEIVDYVSGIGLSMFDKVRKKPSSGKAQKPAITIFKLNNYSWKGHLKRGIRKFIMNANREDLINIGLIKKSADIMFNKKEDILKRCVDESHWDGFNGITIDAWIKIAEHVKTLQAAQIDTVVTSDIHRLIRAERTLHGKTGLLKVEFPVKDLDDFDPFKGAVAFKEGSVKVLVSSAPEFRMGEQTFGPYKNQQVELPTAAAVLLILKGRAEVLT